MNGGMEKMRTLGGILLFWVKAGRRYEKLKNNEEKRDKSVSLGVRSIVQSVICAALAIVALLGLHFFLENLNGTLDSFGPILSLLGVIVTAVLALALLIQGIFGSLVYMVYQFKLNKQPMRFVALIVWILAIAAVVTAALLLLL